MLHIIEERLSLHSPVNHLAIPSQRKAPTKVIVSVAVRNLADQPLAAQATAARPAITYVLAAVSIKKHQVSWVKHALCSHPAPTRPCYVGALLLRRVQGFF